MYAFQSPSAGRRHPTLPRVLICDLSSRSRERLRGVLEDGAETVMAESGEEALRLATAAGPPDLVLSAVKLPGIDGYELCRRVRADERLAQVPIVLLTSPGALEGARAQALESGADDVLTLPVCPRELRARVAALLRLRFMVAALESRARELEATNRFLAQARMELVRTEKLAAIGTLVAGVSQEVDEPLSSITSGVTSLRGDLGDVVLLIGQLMGAKCDREREALSRKLSEVVIETKEILAEMGEGAGRLEQVARELKLIAPAERPPEVEEVDVEEEISRAWKVARLRSSKRPELVVTADRFQRFRTSGPMLRQVLENLLVNAVQALDGQGGGGAIWVSAQEVDGEIVISVRDSGPGIPEKIIHRVFDPFFTTRPGGQGVGLGLSVSDAIVRGLGGSIEAASPEGQGATFTLRLPAARGGREELVDPEESPC